MNVDSKPAHWGSMYTEGVYPSTESLSISVFRSHKNWIVGIFNLYRCLETIGYYLVNDWLYTFYFEMMIFNIFVELFQIEYSSLSAIVLRLVNIGDINSLLQCVVSSGAPFSQSLRI